MKEDLDFISLSEAAKITNYSQDYMSLLCRQGKLKAKKLGRNWVTTKEWVYSYIDNSNGGGASVVPVKVVKEKQKREESKTKNKKQIENEPEEEKEEIKINENCNQKRKINFYGRSALEFAIYCFFSIIIVCNVYAFNSYLEEEKVYSTNTSYYYIYSDDDSGEVAGAFTQKIEESEDKDSNYELVEASDELTIKQEEMLEEIEEVFSDSVEVLELYGEYAVLKYKENSEEKFLFVFEKVK